MAATVFQNGYQFAQGSGYTLPEYPFVSPPELSRKALARKRHNIVIVGGGLTGLTMACALANLGVPAVLLDEDNTVGVKGASSRGICYTQKSLEIFERLGIYTQVANKGVQWSVGRTFAGDDEVYAFDLKIQGGFNLSQQPPFINIQQFYNEGFLAERVFQLNDRAGPDQQVDIRWSSRVTAFDQHQEHATLTVQTPDGNYTIEATHVVDATGAASPFRQWLQVPVTAKRGDDRWCIADVRFSTHPPIERHTWIEAPFNENRAVWQHLMADNVWRIDYQMAPDADPAYVSREDVVRERLRKQFGTDVKVDIVWVGPYAYRSECVHHMRVGSVFFAGDSAKVVSPFGARGGNTGIADADNLAWKLAAVSHGHASPHLLDSYHLERHEAATTNVQVTQRTARFLRAPDGVERQFRTAALTLAKQHVFARSLVNTGRMAVANSYTRSSVCCAGGGVSVQNASFGWTDGSAGCVNDLLRWTSGRLLLLVFGDCSRSAMQRLRALNNNARVRSVHVLAANAKSTARETIQDVRGHLRAACHLPALLGNAWALIRPDAYVAATGTLIDESLVSAISVAWGIDTQAAQNNRGRT